MFRAIAQVYNMHEHGGACGQEIVLTDNRGEVIATPVVNCAPNGTRVPEVFAVMSICSRPCIIDPTSVCCYVPAEVAMLFPCC